MPFICRLFWGDAHLNEVGFMNLDGGARHHVHAKRTSHVSSMAIFDDFLFWSDWNLRQVMRADKWTGGNETILKTTTQLPNDLRVSWSLFLIRIFSVVSIFFFEDVRQN